MEFSKQQSHVSQILKEAVVALCKKFIPFQSDITVEGLLGITIDKQNVILVNILKQVPGPGFTTNPEMCDDVKGMDGLPYFGDPSILSKDWNSPLRSPSILPTDKASDSSGPAVKEEPAQMQTQTSCDQMQQENKSSEKQASLFNASESPQVKGQGLKCLGVRDELLTMDHDFSTFDEISSHLDYNSRLSLSPTKNSSNDLFGKSEDFLSVKEESDPFASQLINDSETGLDDGILPEVLDTDFVEGSFPSSGDKFTCSHCGMIFSHRRSLRRHKKKHEGIHNIWRCDQCTQVFNRKDILLRHVKKHHEVKQLKCPICNRLFSRPDSMKRHMAMAHSDS